MNSLRSAHSRDDKGVAVIALSGAIDERSDIQGALGGSGAKSPVRLNLEGVERINSIGVHRWIPIFDRFCDAHPVRIEALSYPMVLQANMVKNLFARAVIESCLAPYFCGQCDQNRMVLVSRGDVRDERPPERACPVCKKPMAFDELDHYFAFFSRYGAPGAE